MARRKFQIVDKVRTGLEQRCREIETADRKRVAIVHRFEKLGIFYAASAIDAGIERDEYGNWPVDTVCEDISDGIRDTYRGKCPGRLVDIAYRAMLVEFARHGITS